MYKKTLVLLAFGLVVVPAATAVAQSPQEPKSLRGVPSSQTPDSLMPDIGPLFAQTVKSRPLLDRGFAFLAQERWKEAASQFQQALEVAPDILQVHYGLARCYQEAGDIAKALEHYRRSVYETPTLREFSSLQDDQKLQYALLLSQVGQSDEAMYVYNNVVNRLNYREGKPHLKVFLPEFGLLAGQRTYQALLFQAMARTAISLSVNEDKPAMQHIREAVRLSPGSGITHFYLAKRLHISHDTYAEAKAEYLKARSLDLRAVGKAADAELSSSSMRSLTP